MQCFARLVSAFCRQQRRAAAALCALGGLGAAFGCNGGDSHAATEPGAVTLACPAAAISPTPLRRLTRFEFANSVRDVFAVDLPLEDLFPRDEVALGFDNQAGTLSLTDLHVQGFLEAADSVADWVTADPTRLAESFGCSDQTVACARSGVQALGRRLLRRELSTAELDGFDELFGSDVSEAGFREAASRVLAALLQSPEFVYRLERTPTTSASLRELASPFVLASRLSFLFWGSVPDQALLDLAGSGQLSSASDVAREARRLLADPRAQRGVLHFYLQWLDLSDLSEVEKDRTLFTYWDESLRADLGRETQRFLASVLWEDDARFTTLLTAPYTFANAVLADFYGLPVTNPDSDELLRVDFAKGTPRLGILTQGSILSRQAKANQTDPIHRGKFIRQQFFCAPPPPPPPDLVVSPPLLDPRKTTRERFAEHRSQAACAGCHELLDPVGFLFEHYDAIGRFRATESDVPIDATGYLTATDIPGTLDGVSELAPKLANSKEVRSCVVKQWFRYAFSRGETEQDACTLGKLEQVFDATQGNLSELLVALTQTDPFLFATPAPDPESP